ncbi:hypothetical protein OOK41_00050 [Micromonospora sp. NBC_01655]|uniref:hypothetical protein n=1 Tax=Micromonospora sp. NBC_01655 TaxID=2975983 RepID=UPI00225B2D50|nr:hypothetical protein [Micromonospora sp. NBC_01655]MCX4468722.1 hypothetical protein [Micromonospora sp. NBC_01655]
MELRKGILDAVPALKAAVRADAAAYLPDRYARELVPSMRMTTATTTTGDQVTGTDALAAKGCGVTPGRSPAWRADGSSTRCSGAAAR